MSQKLRDYFSMDRKAAKGLLPLEWAVLCYLALTLVVMAVMHNRLHSFDTMLLFRFRVVVLMAVMWGLYRLVPCKAMMFVRVAIQIGMLVDWYPDTYEFNRCFENLDHLFCGIEQTLFGCQPSIVMSRLLPWGIVSEPLDMGYVSYYPIIFFTTLFYFLHRQKDFQRAVFVIMGSFFLNYVIFIFVPVAGPTFYFKAVGLDIIEQGVFPAIGHYFEYHNDLAADCLTTPGWRGGPMWYLVEVAKWAGERPTAAFPSSHVSVTVVCLLLLLKSGNRKVFWLTLPFGVLMFFATIYIQAHYAIDALGGIVVGVVFFLLLYYGYKPLFRK